MTNSAITFNALSNMDDLQKFNAITLFMKNDLSDELKDLGVKALLGWGNDKEVKQIPALCAIAELSAKGNLSLNLVNAIIEIANLPKIRNW